MNRKYKYKLEFFEVRVGRTPFEVGAPFQVGEFFFDFKLALFSSSSWRPFLSQRTISRRAHSMTVHTSFKFNSTHFFESAHFFKAA